MTAWGHSRPVRARSKSSRVRCASEAEVKCVGMFRNSPCGFPNEPALGTNRIPDTGSGSGRYWRKANEIVLDVARQV